MVWNLWIPRPGLREGREDSRERAIIWARGARTCLPSIAQGNLGRSRGLARACLVRQTLLARDWIGLREPCLTRPPASMSSRSCQLQPTACTEPSSTISRRPCLGDTLPRSATPGRLSCSQCRSGGTPLRLRRKVIPQCASVTTPSARISLGASPGLEVASNLGPAV